jgi:uncharacterized protein (DUF1800 family)
MSEASGKSSVSRRLFLGSSAIAGAAALTLPLAKTAQAQAKRFAGLKTLKPAPTVVHSAVPAPPIAPLVLNKATYGPRPGDVAAFNALGADDGSRLAAWLEIQLNPTGSDPEVDDRVNPLTAEGMVYDRINSSALDLWQIGRDPDYSTRNRPLFQMERLVLLRALYSKWQLRELLSDFWFNHFNIYGREFPAYAMMPNYDAVIRQHIFGNFKQMLNANAKTASMLYYLDNFANTWPNPNENYAREVLELHTLGAVENYYGPVDPGTVGNNPEGQRAGYTEIDVFEFAKALTGWGVNDTRDEGDDTGEFLFRTPRHYNFSQGDIQVMDITIASPGNGEADVTDILDYLADHFGTARYIARKLVMRFIDDDPPESLVESTAQQFFARRNDGDQLKEVYRHVLSSKEFQTTWGNKVKRPVETVIRGLRAASVNLTLQLNEGEGNLHGQATNNLLSRLDDTGHYPFRFEPPTGFPDERAQWQGSGPLVQSWRTLTRMLRDPNIVNLAEQTNGEIALEADRTPQNIVDMWMDRALGYALSPAVADLVATYIGNIAGVANAAQLDPNVNTSDTGANSQYQRIIRGALGLILMSPDAMRR